MASTIELDRESLTVPRQETIRGVDVQVRPSPYDVPRSMRITRSVDLFHDDIAIIFEYLAEPEAAESVNFEGPVTLFVGKKSSRVYQIMIPLHSLDPMSPGFVKRGNHAIQNAFAQLEKQRLDVRRHFHYRIIERLIEQHHEEVFGIFKGAESQARLSE